MERFGLSKERAEHLIKEFNAQKYLKYTDIIDSKFSQEFTSGELAALAYTLGRSEQANIDLAQLEQSSRQRLALALDTNRLLIEIREKAAEHRKHTDYIVYGGTLIYIILMITSFFVNRSVVQNLKRTYDNERAYETLTKSKLPIYYRYVLKLDAEAPK